MKFPSCLRAVAFDLDGTLIDNMKAHAQAWIETAHSFQLPLTEERFQREFAGRKNSEIFSALLGRELEPAEVAKLSAQKEERFRRLYRPKLALLPGTERWFDELDQAGIPMALATAAPAENRAMVLGDLGIAARFRFIVGPEEIARGKPHPDLFLAAAQGLGLPPEACLAFEDAVNGVLAARAAGLPVVGITTSESAAELRSAGAFATAADYTVLPRICRECLGLLPAPETAPPPPSSP